MIKAKRAILEEDPLFVHPAELKQLLEEYEPIDMCLRPAPIVLHLDGLRIKIPSPDATISNNLLTNRYIFIVYQISAICTPRS